MISYPVAFDFNKSSMFSLTSNTTAMMTKAKIIKRKVPKNFFKMNRSKMPITSEYLKC